MVVVFSIQIFLIMLTQEISCPTSLFQDPKNLLIFDQITKEFYKFDSVTLVVSSAITSEVNKFWRKQKTLQFTSILNFDQQTSKNYNISALSKLGGNDAMFVFLEHDHQTSRFFRKVIAAKSLDFSNLNWFVRVNSRTDLTDLLSSHLTFDSKLNFLIENDKLGIVELYEVYSVQVINKVQTHVNKYGQFANEQLVIETPYIWDRRTNFHGAQFRAGLESVICYSRSGLLFFFLFQIFFLILEICVVTVTVQRKDVVQVS